jgi:nicotinamidase-related amidase
MSSYANGASPRSSSLVSRQSSESAARSAFDLGYDVLVNDAVTDLDDDNHRHTLERIIPRLGEQATTADVLALLKVTFV